MDSNPTSLRGGATDCHSKRLVVHMIASCLEKLEQTKRKNLMFICQSDMHQTFYWNKLEITVSTFTFCKRVLHNTNRTKQTWSAEQRQRTATLADDLELYSTHSLHWHRDWHWHRHRRHPLIDGFIVLCPQSSLTFRFSDKEWQALNIETSNTRVLVLIAIACAWQVRVLAS